MKAFRLIPALEEREWLVERVQTSGGRAVLLVVFLASLAVLVRGQLLVDTAIVLVGIVAFPAQRRTIMVFGALYWAVAHVPLRWDVLTELARRGGARLELGDTGAFRAQIAAAVLITCALAHRALRARPKHPFTLYPALPLIVIYGGAVAWLSFVPATGALQIYSWAFVLFFGQYLWFLAYSLMDLRSSPEREFSWQLGIFQPFWGSTHTPFPKGAAYVDRIEAKDPRSLAITQLKGLKLLWWSLVLAGIGYLLRASFFGQPLIFSTRIPFGLPVPPLEIAFKASVLGRPFPWHQNSLAMFLDLALDGLNLAVWGHRFISIARMAGFDARRNTYKPFLAQSVSDFFNRYYYYFKELLVDCFFYPVFYSLPRRRLKLALFVATMMAAGVGNFAYHLLRDVHVIAERGLPRTLYDSRVHALYCFLLALGIFVSQLRRVGKRVVKRSGFAKWRAIALVWLFFALLSTLYVDMRNTSFTDHLRFFLDSLPSSIR